MENLYPLLIAVLLLAAFAVLRVYDPRRIIVYEYERGIKYTGGRFEKTLEPQRG